MTAMFPMQRRTRQLLVLLMLGGCSDRTQPLDGADSGASHPQDVGQSADTGLAPDAGQPLDAAIDAGMDAGRAPVGAPCTERADCASADSPSADLYPNSCMGGWPGGYCVDYCTLPADALVLPELTQADCSVGEVCLSRSAVPGQHPEESIGACVKACEVDEDCRTDEGYFCRRSFWKDGLELIFDNGYCGPAHCSSRGCPSSYACQC